MMRRFLAIPIFALVTALAFAASGCAKQTSTDPTDPGNNPTPGVVDDGAGFYVRYVTNTKYFYDLHKDATGFGTACSAVANESVQCFMEAPELDMNFNGVTLQFNVPSSMCTYLRFSPYYFIRYAVAAAPTFVNVDTVANGSICGDTNSNGVCDVGEVDERCAYDYTGNDGPNCCEGGYTKVTRAWDASLPGYGAPVTTEEKWGGKVGNCLSGPATKTQEKTESNIPKPDLYFIDGTGLNKTYVIDAPTTLNFGTNTYLANYFDPLDHGGGAPAGLTATSAVTPQPLYVWQCLDRAEDVVAEIELQIREWNTKAAFDARVSAPTGYDAAGPEDSPFNGSNVKNDRADWADFDALFPGDFL